MIGNVINDPPPARVLITPENNPQINNMTITSVSIIFYFTTEEVCTSTHRDACLTDVGWI